MGTVPAKPPFRIAALMSGTSADGVDAAIVDFRPRGKIDLKAFATFPYRPAVRRRILHLAGASHVAMDDLARLDFLLGEIFAEAVIALARRKRIALGSIDLIGSHGQTIRHLPAAVKFCGRLVRATMQIGEPSIIAQRTGITTVADFRPRDIAAGGEGAPLVPLADWLMFRHPRRGRAIQNIGGIANVTWLPAGGGSDQIVAFDTGPGNMIIDYLVSEITGGRETFDRDGRLAAQGCIHRPTLRRLLGAAYFRREPPKTAGREQFGRRFADKLLQRGRSDGLGDADIIATATAFTAASIARAYRNHLPAMPDEIVLCGGGARNHTLRAMLAADLGDAKIITSDELGIDADAKEAVSFAVLARQTVLGRPGNVPSATGAKHPVVLGKIVPGTLW